MGPVYRRLHYLSVLSASDTTHYLWFWKLETFWMSFHWLASKREHQKANSVLEYDVVILWQVPQVLRILAIHNQEATCVELLSSVMDS